MNGENEQRELTKRQFNIAIGIILLWGFSVNAVMCIFLADVFQAWDRTLVPYGYGLMAVIGIRLSYSLNKPLLCFIGYNLVILPMGTVLCIAVEGISAATILRVCIITISLTVLMLVIAVINPEVFDSMEMIIFVSLAGAFVIEAVMSYFKMTIPRWWDWVVILPFCGYIGYDWSNAQKYTRTLDGAIGCGTGLYLWIVNLFLRLLGRLKRQY